jgi:hypothetical protein
MNAAGAALVFVGVLVVVQVLAGNALARLRVTS